MTRTCGHELMAQNHIGGGIITCKPIKVEPCGRDQFQGEV